MIRRSLVDEPGEVKCFHLACASSLNARLCVWNVFFLFSVIAVANWTRTLYFQRCADYVLSAAVSSGRGRGKDQEPATGDATRQRTGR